MRAICQLCGEVYAIVNLETLRYPLTGAMFGSPDKFHGTPAPFDPSLDWEFFRCPHGRIHRPMVQDDLVLTDLGMVRLPKDGSPAFLDPTASGEVDRDSISDRVLQVSDEEAERQVRRRRIDEFCEAVKGTLPLRTEEDGPVSTTEPFEAFPCPTCGKEFDTERKMKGHQGGAHRKKKNQELYNWCPRCLPKHTALFATEDNPNVVFCDIHGEMPRSKIEEEFKKLDAAHKRRKR